MSTDAIEVSPTAAQRALFEGLFDYAGLFPPAKLPMHEVAQNFCCYALGPYAWMLKRLVVPAARLQELADAAAQFDGWDSSAVELSLVVADWSAECEAVETFAKQNVARVAAIETKAWQPKLLESGAEVYVELPDALGIADLDKADSVFAKIRTGGLVAEAFPSEEAVVEFLEACVINKCACKATAGLHHPLPADRPSCDATDAPIVPMHGFVVVVLAATLLKQGGAAETAVELLQETEAAAIVLGERAVAWREHRFEAGQIAKVRKSLFHSIGSCSFDEPIEDLLELGWLG
ncbi:MAG: hypothetical protein VXZ82_13700 [Planctomycetota bacterium]|nr:hypothetical protein [Planctomycetota bacterium]